MATDTKTVPPVPYKAVVVDGSGFLTSAWSAWFRQVFMRVGGSVALSNAELAALPALNLSTVEADITALQASVSALQVKDNDFGQGPDL